MPVRLGIRQRGDYGAYNAEFAVSDFPHMDASLNRIALILASGATPSSVMLTLDMLAIAVRYPEAAGCRLELFSVNGGEVTLTAGARIDTQPLPASLDGFAAVIMPGFLASDPAHLLGQLSEIWPPVIERLRQLPPETLVAASCYGTFVLAESGLLDGCAATTTWWMEGFFHQRYPAVRLNAASALVDGGRCLTAGAMTAHTDLVLHVLRRQFGAALARKVGGIMLVDGARTSQRPFVVPARSFADPLAQQAADWLAARLVERVTTRQLADALAVSYRTLHRRFEAAVGKPPLAYLQTLRVERAKEMLEESRLSLAQIVEKVGYADTSAFRRLFAREVGLTPAAYRQRFRQPTTAFQGSNFS